MKKILLTTFFLIAAFTTQSQNIFGKWHSTNEDTGEVDSVIEVYKKNGKAFAKVIEIKNPMRKNAVCDLCSEENKNKPVLGLNILTGLEKMGKNGQEEKFWILEMAKSTNVISSLKMRIS